MGTKNSNQNLMIFPEMVTAFIYAPKSVFLTSIWQEIREMIVKSGFSFPFSLHSLDTGVLGVQPASFQLLLFGLGISDIAAVLLILLPTLGIRRTSCKPLFFCIVQPMHTMYIPVYTLKNGHTRSLNYLSVCPQINSNIFFSWFQGLWGHLLPIPSHPQKEEELADINKSSQNER